MPPDVSPRTPVRFRSRPLSLTPTFLDPDGRAPARQAPSLLLGGGGGGGEDSEEELEVIDIDEVASGWGESCEEEEAGQQAEALLDWAVESGALHAAVVVLLTVILLDVLLYAGNSRAQASANSASSTPRQRQIKLRAALQPRRVGKHLLALFVTHAGLVFHTGSA